MGRMADARKRAKRAEAPPPAPEAAPAAAAADAGTPPADLVFDDEAPAPAPQDPEPTDSGVGLEPPPGAPARIELPASGLAEDILARHEAALVAVAEAEPAAPAPVPAAAPAAAVPDAAPTAGHSLSFFAAPVQDQRAAAEATEHLVTFYLDREEYGVDVRQVQEIRRVGDITSVPRAPEFVRGVINLRGRILPVLDLKRKLALGEVAASRNSRIVVVRVRERLLGLLVDGASQVPKIPVSRIEAAPEEVVERGGDYIRGVAKLDDRLIILVDLERLLAQELRAAAANRPVAGESA
ncbi:MAG: chemotaxis protein CheW [Vicinamibacteria bacterium]